MKPYIYEAIRPFYRLYGKEDAFQFHTDTTVLAHNYDHDNRQHTYAFLDKWFGLKMSSREIPVGQDVDSYRELSAGLPENNLTILRLAKQFVGELRHLAAPAGVSARARWAKAERAKLAQVVHYQPATVVQPWYVDDTDHNTVQSISFRFGLSNGLSATGVWLRSQWTPKGAPMTVVIDDAGRKGAAGRVWDHYSEVGYLLEHGEQALVLSIAFTGDATPEDAGRFGAMMAAVGTPPLGLEAAQLIGITRWAEARWHPSRMRLESSGYRMQVVSLVAGALEPKLFERISIHGGMRSLGYLLSKGVKSSDVPDMFCRDFYKDFDLSMLRAMAGPEEVIQDSYLVTGR